MQKRLGILGIFLMVLMFVLSSGFAFAENEFTSYSLTSKLGWDLTSADIKDNSLTINYSNNLEDRLSCRTTDKSVLGVKYSTEHRGLFLVVFLVNDSFNSEKGIDDFLYDSLSNRGTGVNETEDTLKKYNNYLGTNDPTFKNNLKEYINEDYNLIIIKIEDDFKKNQNYSYKFNIADFYNYNKAYIYLYDHCGFFSSFYHNDFQNSKNLAKAVYTFSLNESTVKSISSINLTHSIVEENKIKLDSNVSDNVNIYYTLNDFNIDKYFKDKIKELNSSEKLKNYLNTKEIKVNIEGVEYSVKKYTSPVTLSSGQKLNAIAVNFNTLTLSNYLQGITLGDSASGQSSSTKKFLINFKDDLKNNNIICEKETKICYYNNWSNIDVIIEKVYSDKPVYFSINQLTKDYTNKVSKNNPGNLSGNEISLGVGNYVSSAQTNFNIKNNSKDNYFLAAMQDNTNVDYLFFVYLNKVDFNSLIEYKIYQKIINSAYCDGCSIPDWMPYNIITPAYQDPVCEQTVREDGKVEESCKPRDDTNKPSVDDSSDCKYTGDYEILCNFNIFDIEKKIGSTSISSSAGTFSPKETYYLEIKFYYDNKKSTFNSNLEAYKLFESEKKNFNLTENEIAIFFSIIGGESSFLNNQVGDKGESIGLAQINKPIWRTSQGFNDLKVYLPNSINTVEKYYTYFDESGSDLNKSLYLGLAVFKYNLNYAKTNITEFNSRYTDIDKAFIMFYAHQFNIRDTRTFFNTVTIPADKDNVNVNCAGTGNELFQNSSQKKLGCVATVGSVRKIGWYLFYLNK